VIRSLFAIFLLTTCLIGIADAQVPVNRYSLGWQARLANDHFVNDTDEANLVKTSLGFRGEMKLLENLTLNSDFNFYWSTGRAQSWYGADGYSTGLNFNQAIIKFSPISFVELQAGAISLSDLRSPLLVASGPFPGVFAKLSFAGNDLVDFGFSALYSLPTSRSLNSDRIEKEAEPSFIALTSTLATGKSFDLLGADFIFSFYKYNNLPSKVAYESSIKGNSVVLNTDADSRFIYKYQGISAGIGGFFTFLEKYKLTAHYTYLLNTDGPNSGNRGEIVQIGCDIPLMKHLLTPFFELFYNEADSSVAYYNSTSYGNNNRQGISLGANFKYEDVFSVKFRYTNADLINVNNSVSSRNQLLFLGLETSFISLL